MTQQNQFAAAIAAAAAVTDITKAQGGGDFEPLAEGPCRLRFVGYVETGKHESTFKGVKKVGAKVRLLFEVSGPKHPPKEIDGVKYPNFIEIKEGLSLNVKARFFKLAQILNHAGTATHLAELLGSAYKGTIVHRKYEINGEKRVAVELYDKAKGAWTIEPARKLNDDTGEYEPLEVAPALSPLKCFIWDFADMAQWASIFVEGQYEERKNDKGEVIAPAKSKNVLQNLIKSAKNFQGSPIHTLLLNNGEPLDIPEVGEVDDTEEEGEDQTKPAAKAPAKAAPTGADADAALAGIVG